MTTAARPTWHPALGGHSLRDTNKAPIHQVSARELACHTVLKVRKPGQNAPSDIQSVDLKERLRKQENESKNNGLLIKPAQPEEEEEDNQDADDSSDDSSDEDDEEEDDDEDTNALMRELEKIKQERAIEKMKAEQEAEELAQSQMEVEAMQGNPLLNPNVPNIKRRWDDDVIFRNQGAEPVLKKRFINDLIRSDFHRKFMTKYIK